jgi:hypothetical protein
MPTLAPHHGLGPVVRIPEVGKRGSVNELLLVLRQRREQSSNDSLYLDWRLEFIGHFQWRFLSSHRKLLI